MDHSDRIESKLWRTISDSRVVLDRIVRGEGHQAVEASTICLLSKAAFEMGAVVSELKYLLGVATSSQQELEKQLGPIVLKLAVGITSLPDELLSIIFQFAVREEGFRGTRQAANLSLVSRRFHQVALNEPSLWTNLRSDSSKEALEALALRSGKAVDLQLFINLVATGRGGDTSDFDFIESLGTTAPRWKTMSFQEFSSSRSKYGVWHSTHDPDDFFFKLSQGGVKHLPRLEELSVTHAGRLFQHTTISWICPKLHTLRCNNYFPTPSTSFASMTTFHLKLQLDKCAHENKKRTEKLLAFLASPSQLSSFELELDRVDPHYGPRRSGWKRSPFPNFVTLPVKSFRLQLFQRFRFEIPEKRKKLWYLKALLEALHMPDLADLSIAVDVQNIGESERERADLLYDLSSAMLPSHLADASNGLPLINYKITCNGDHAEDKNSKTHKPSQFPTTFTIPLDRIRNFSTITIMSCARVVFAWKDEAQRGLRGEAESKASRLRDIQLVGCDDMEIKDFRAAIVSLKDAGAWGTVERVSVEFCPLLEYAELLEVVGKERLRMPGNSHVDRQREVAS